MTSNTTAMRGRRSLGDPSRGVFSTPQAARITGTQQSTVSYWARTGFLTPSAQETTGTGVYRLYGFRDLICLRVARELRDAGVSLQGLRQVNDYLQTRNDLEHPLAETFLVTDGHDVYEKGADDVFSLLRNPGQATFRFVSLPNAVEDVRKGIEELTKAA
jgi:DNA-binding transcriptional MerR regulator